MLALTPPASRRLASLAALTLLALAAGCGEKEECYTLGPPMLKAEQILRTESEAVGMQGNVIRISGETKETGYLNVKRRQVIEQTVAAVDKNSHPTRSDFRILEDHSRTDLVWGDLMHSKEAESPLVDQTLMASVNAGLWSFRLADGKPTREQLAEMAELDAYENRRWYPGVPVAVGNQWPFDPAFIRHLLQEDLAEVEALGVMELREITERDGVPYARILIKLSTEGLDTGEVEAGGREARFEFNGHMEYDLERQLDTRLLLVGLLVSEVRGEEESRRVELPLKIEVTKTILDESSEPATVEAQPGD